MLKVKGPLFKSTLKFIKGKIGDSRFESFLEKLPQETKDFLNRSILTSEFYPADHLISINEAFVQMAGLDPIPTYIDMGRMSSDEGFKGVYKIFLKVGSPRLMVRQAPLVWKSYYNQGKLLTEDVGAREVVVRIVESGIRHVSLCSRISGFIERTMELSGGKNIEFTHTKCFEKGDDLEEWTSTWE